VHPSSAFGPGRIPRALLSGGVRGFGRGMCCILSRRTGIRGSGCGVTESVGTGRCGKTLEWRPRAWKAGVRGFGLGRRADDSEDLEVDSGILLSNDGEGELTNTALRSFVVFEVQANHMRGAGGRSDVSAGAAVRRPLRRGRRTASSSPYVGLRNTLRFGTRHKQRQFEQTRWLSGTS
jgi:hypothetical protein